MLILKKIMIGGSTGEGTSIAQSPQVDTILNFMYEIEIVDRHFHLN